MQPLVIIVILNWNRASDTIACLHSLEGLDYRNYRVVVVDNGSTDDSVRQIKQEFPGIVVLETGKNLGFSGGNNVGIRFALEHGAEYVWLLNNDTIADAHSLSAMVETAESDKAIGAVGSVLYYMDHPDRVQAWGGGWVNLWTGRAGHYKAPVPCEKLHYITGASLLLRSEALKEVGLLDERYFMYWEDTDLGFRLRKAGWTLAVAPNSRVLHKESASLGKRNHVMDRYFNRSAIIFFQTHADFSFIPIFIGVGGRLLKRVLRNDWRGVQSIIRVVFQKHNQNYA